MLNISIDTIIITSTPSISNISIPRPQAFKSEFISVVHFFSYFFHFKFFFNWYSSLNHQLIQLFPGKLALNIAKAKCIKLSKDSLFMEEKI